jgi:hypothetical protein
MTSPSNTPRHRPRSLPADARWEPEHPGFEWQQGALDAEGRRHGAYRSWNADGVLHGACWYEHGVLHGANTSYHPDGSVSSVGEWVDGTCMNAVYYRCDGPTTEPFPEGGPNVRSVRSYTRDGRSSYTIRYFDESGAEVGPDGQPLPPRPEAVSPDARWSPDLDRWIDGAIERGTNHQIGPWRWWSRAGVLLHEELRDAAGEPTMTADYSDEGTLEKRVTRTAAGEEREYYGGSGVLSMRYRDDPAGREVYKGSWYEDGTLEAEVVRVYDGDRLASVIERGEGGALTFAARREGDAMACVLYGPRGAVRATGLIRARPGRSGAAAGGGPTEGYRGRLHGVWRILGEAGELEREFDATPLELEQDAEASGLEHTLGQALFELDEPALPTPPHLAGVDAVAWDELEGAYEESVELFPRYLRALASPEPLVREYALGMIAGEIEHQGSTYSSTAAVIPWLARLLSHPNADRSALLAVIQEAGEAALPYRDHFEDGEGGGEDDGDDDGRVAIVGTCDAVARAWPQIWALFPDASQEDRRRILVLAKLAPDAAAMVAEVARRDPDPAMRACAVDSASQVRGGDAAQLAPVLGDPDPLVRAAAAIALGCRRGPAAPPETVPAIAEAIRDFRALAPRFAALPYTDGHLLAYLALAAGAICSPEARELIRPLCALIDELDGVSATTFGQGLCALAFGRGERPFAPQFLDVLDTLARSRQFWAFNVNAGEVLDRWNLRTGIGDDARTALAALIAELRVAPDPEAVLHARMHAADEDQEAAEDEDEDEAD